jgi:hypothetical protein
VRFEKNTKCKKKTVLFKLKKRDFILEDELIVEWHRSTLGFAQFKLDLFCPSFALFNATIVCVCVRERERERERGKEREREGEREGEVKRDDTEKGRGRKN